MLTDNRTITCRSLAPQWPHDADVSQPVGGALFVTGELIRETAIADKQLHWELLDLETADHPPQQPLLSLMHRGHQAIPQAGINVLPLKEWSRDGDAVMVCNFPQLPTFAAYRQATNQVRPICTLIHALIPSDLLLTRALMEQACEGDIFLTPSHATRRALLNFVESSAVEKDYSFPSSAVMVQPFGTTIPPMAALDHVSARNAIDLPLDRFIILVVGRITRDYKGDLGSLVVAAGQIAQERPCLLLVAGHIENYLYLEQLLETARSQAPLLEIRVLPSFGAEQKTFIYSSADVVVSIADSIQESYGLVLIEAMAHARPVIATDWSAAREIIREGQTGYLIPTYWPCDESGLSAAEDSSVFVPGRTLAGAIARNTFIDCARLIELLRVLSRDTQRLHALGAAGRVEAERNYSWTVCAHRFIEVWREQVEVSRRAQRKRTRSPRWLSATFSHYASSRLDGDQVISQAQPSTLAWQLVLGSNTDQLYRRQCYALRDSVRESAKSLRELEHLGDHDAIANFIRYGYWRIASLQERQ